MSQLRPRTRWTNVFVLHPAVLRIFVLLNCIVLSPWARCQQLLYAANSRPILDAGVTFRSNVAEVRLTFYVTDEHHRPVTGLRQDQVVVFDGSEPAETVTDFRADSELPLRLVLLVDRSDSLTKYLAEEQRVAAGFAGRVLRPGDQAFVAGFGTTMAPLEPLTADGDAVRRAIDHRAKVELTALFDALLQCARESPRSQGALERRAIILLSDGEDTYSIHSLPEAIEAAQRADIPIYAISSHPSQGDGVMQQLAQATGGRWLTVSRSQSLEQVFAEIERELRSQYTIAFPPGERNGQFHPLHLFVQGAGEVQIQARSGYWAPSR